MKVFSDTVDGKRSSSPDNWIYSSSPSRTRHWNEKSARGATVQKFVRLPVPRRQSLQWSTLNIGRRMSPWPAVVEAGNTIGREESAGTERV